MASGTASVRSRFIALLLVAAIPLSLVGGLIAFKNSRMLADAVRERLSTASDSMRVRHRGFLAEGERLLTSLSLSPSMLAGEHACAAVLSRILAVSPERYHSLSVIGPDGHPRCQAGDASTGPPLGVAEAVAAATASGRFAVGQIARDGLSGRPLLPIAIPAPDIASTIVATLDEGSLLEGVGWFASQPGLGAWILSRAGGPVMLAGPGDDALPSAGLIMRLEHVTGGVVEGLSRGGAAYVYMLTDLRAGGRLLLGEPATASLSAAELVLGRRLAELALVLVIGLMIAAVGAEYSVGRPLKQVARAVARWRAGGRFDPGPLRGAPVEIIDLARSFSEASAALRVRERQLREAVSHQELLMQEIHHRVKNNLQVVASLLNLQASRIRQPEAQAAFHAARDRIRALATLHRHLYAHGELHTINMRAFLDELCQQLLQAMGETPSTGRIALTIEAPELQISSDQAVPMALLVTEAMSNAVKYAFPGGRSGHIAVHMTVRRDQAEQEVARLSIDDDGIGIPAGRFDDESGASDGLGLRLIRGFARQLGSTLQVTEEHGTHYVVDGIVLRRERTAELPPSVEDELDPDPD